MSANVLKTDVQLSVAGNSARLHQREYIEVIDVVYRDVSDASCGKSHRHPPINQRPLPRRLRRVYVRHSFRTPPTNEATRDALQRARRNTCRDEYNTCANNHDEPAFARAARRQCLTSSRNATTKHAVNDNPPTRPKTLRRPSTTVARDNFQSNLYNTCKNVGTVDLCSSSSTTSEGAIDDDAKTDHGCERNSRVHTSRRKRIGNKSGACDGERRRVFSTKNGDVQQVRLLINT